MGNANILEFYGLLISFKCINDLVQRRDTHVWQWWINDRMDDD